MGVFLWTGIFEHHGNGGHQKDEKKNSEKGEFIHWACVDFPEVKREMLKTFRLMQMQLSSSVAGEEFLLYNIRGKESEKT